MQKKMFFLSLAKNIADIEIPADIFKGNGSKDFTSQSESINIKNAFIPLTGYIRVYALHSKVTESNSLQRLEKLRRLNIIPEHECHELENMYCRLMEIRFRSQVNAILANRAPDNMVDEQELAAIEQTLIRKTFSEIIRFQNMILNDFSS
jgi:CBS domain-containing protein